MRMSMDDEMWWEVSVVQQEWLCPWSVDASELSGLVRLSMLNEHICYKKG
jgi:hypothetical protein